MSAPETPTPPRRARKRTTPEGEAILKAETTPQNDPAPKDTPPPERDSEGDAPPANDAPRRGRPPGSKNVRSGSRKSTRLGEIEAGARTAWGRTLSLVGFSVFSNPMFMPQQKVLYLNDVEILRSEDATNAVVGCLRLACERNSKLEAACLRMLAASAYTGIGATVVFGIVLPIMTNHGVIPAPIASMLGVQMPDDMINVRTPSPPPPPTRDVHEEMRQNSPSDEFVPPPPPPPREPHPADAPPPPPPLEMAPADPEQPMVFGRQEIDPELFG